MRDRIRLLAIVTILAGLCGCVTHASDEPKVAVPGPSPLTVEIGAQEAIWLDLPNGEVSVVAANVRYAELHASLRCPTNSRKCRERAADIAFEVRRDERGVVLSTNRSATLDSEFVVNVRVPKPNALDIRMKYGSLSIENVEQPLAVNMKAGEVQITMPEKAVKSAFLRARFGDASLTVPDSAISGRRPTLVGATVDWPHGRGRFPVSAKLRYGDVRLRLLD